MAGEVDWRASLDQLTLPFQKAVAKWTTPHPDQLGHSLFSARIRDRRQRWQTEGQANPYSAIGSKANGQTYMRSLGYAVPERYGVYPSLDEIPHFDDLPPTFVLKPVSSWSVNGVFLMRGGVDWFTKRRLSRDQLIRAARSIPDAEKKGIAGAWMAEELLVNFDDSGEPAQDYRFYCFGPRVVVMTICRRTSMVVWQNDNWVRDPDWRELPFRLKWDLFPSRSVLTRPPFLDQMLQIASDVGERLNIFIRIDMYATQRGPVFGEFTAYPGMGLHYTPRGDAWLGSHWKTLDGGVETAARPLSDP